MLLQVYITTAKEMNVHIVTEQNGILLVLMNYKCCYVTCKKLLHLHSVANPYLIICGCFTNNKSPGRLRSTLSLEDRFKTPILSSDGKSFSGLVWTFIMLPSTLPQTSIRNAKPLTSTF